MIWPDGVRVTASPVLYVRWQREQQRIVHQFPVGLSLPDVFCAVCGILPMVGGGPPLVHFGSRWEGPMFDTGMWLRVITPVDWPCVKCSELIEANDRGLFIRVDNPHAELGPVHLECQLRSVIGNLLHLNGQCGCWGAPQEPHAKNLRETYRDESRAVLAWLNQRRERAGLSPM